MRDRTEDHRRRTRTGAKLLGLSCVLGAFALTSGPARAAGDPWSDDARWVSVRVGSAGSGARLAPIGSVGYGFGYTWFLADQLAWSATVQHDVLGRYGDASEIDVPITVEFTKHFRFSPSIRPYMGGGLGAIYHKTYRTYRQTSPTTRIPTDEAGFRQGIYVAVGGNAALSPGSLVGFDYRLMQEQDTRSINPTFPNPAASTRNWSMKLSYSRVL